MKRASLFCSFVGIMQRQMRDIRSRVSHLGAPAESKAKREIFFSAFQKRGVNDPQESDDESAFNYVRLNSAATI